MPSLPDQAPARRSPLSSEDGGSVSAGRMLERVEAVRAEIAGLRATLIPPDGVAPAPRAIAGTAPALERAASDLRGLIGDLERAAAPPDAMPSPGLRRSLAALREELHRVARLIGHAALLNAGWARVLAVAAGGYTPAGEPAPLEAAGTVSFEG